VVGGVLRCREGVEVAAGGVDGAADLGGRAGPRPLEQQVLEEVRRAREVADLVAAADPDPAAERDRAGPGNRLGGDPEPARQAFQCDQRSDR
jgi:hypothetical protein